MVQPSLSILSNFWQAQMQLLEQSEVDFKNYQLPLARIKKVMKTDDEVKPMVQPSHDPLDDQCRSSYYFCKGLRNLYLGADPSLLDANGRK